MKTVKQLAAQVGISVRTLHHYDAIGLLRPSQVTQAGYRLYDDAAAERLCLILLFRELGFPLKQIRAILDAPDFDRNQILSQQVQLLEQRKAHLQNLANMARGIRLVGVKYLEMQDFDFQKIDDYAAQAKTLYGKSDAYQQCVQKAAARTAQQNQKVNGQLMDFFAALGQISRSKIPAVKLRSSGFASCKPSSRSITMTARSRSCWGWEICTPAAAP